MSSEFQKSITQFMQLAKQEIPSKGKYTEPIVTDDDLFVAKEVHREWPFKIRMLRARLILEEAEETIKGLGFYITDQGGKITLGAANTHTYDLEEVIDGCCDLLVVTIGTLSALNVDDEVVMREVCNANLRKFAEGHSYRPDGKLIKPPDFIPPDVLTVAKYGEDLTIYLTDK